MKMATATMASAVASTTLTAVVFLRSPLFVKASVIRSGAFTVGWNFVVEKRATATTRTMSCCVCSSTRVGAPAFASVGSETRLFFGSRRYHGKSEGKKRNCGGARVGGQDRQFSTTTLRMRRKASDSLGGSYRADRVLSNRTGRSRSECFDLLKQKRVWQVVTDRDDDQEDDLRLVAGPSSRIHMCAELRIDRVHAVPMPPPLAVAYHKPVWVLSSRRDDATLDRPCLDSSILPGLHPVGRLDYDTSGLILFSSSGALTQRLLHPKHGVEKEYEATVAGRAELLSLRQRLAAGIPLKEGLFSADVLSAEPVSDEDVRPYLERVQEGMPSHYNRTDLRSRGYLDVFDAQQLTVVRLTVCEGKYRMVRRMLKTAGHEVVSLKRVRLGAVTLGDLPPGSHRPLTADELAWAERQLPERKMRTPKHSGKKGARSE